MVTASISFAFCFRSNIFNIFTMWRHGVVVITTAQVHSLKPGHRFFAGSNPARAVSDNRDGEDLWQWTRLEIKVTILRKQFTFIIKYTITEDKQLQKRKRGHFRAHQARSSVTLTVVGWLQRQRGLHNFFWLFWT